MIDLDLRAKHNINIIAVKNEDGVNVNPSPEYSIKQKDILAVVGSIATINILIKDKG